LRTGEITKIDGISVNPKSAIKVITVLACCRVLAESIASLSLITYKNLKPRGKERATSHNLYYILHTKTNQFMTAYQFRECMMYQALLYKGAYAVIRYDNDGKVTEIMPLKAGATQPAFDDNGKLWYLTVIDGVQYALHADEVLYIPSPSLDGLVSESIIDLAKNAITLSMATEDHGIDFFAGGAKPGAVLLYDKQLSDPAYQRLKEAWNTKSKNRAGAIKILESDIKYQESTMANDKAQFLESRKFQREEIAAAYRVPPHLVGDLSRSTNNNIEHQSLEFVIYTLTPWLVKWEQEINTKLFIDKEREIYHSEFLVESLLRGDLKSRYEAYAVGKNNGFLTTNMILAKENENPVPGGDEFYVPANMIPNSLVNDFWASKNAQTTPIADPPKK
jgi:HK97 family phage portal protein